MRPGEESSLSGVAAWISSQSSPSSSLCHLFQIESGGMRLLDTLQSPLRVFRARPGMLPLPAAEGRRNSLALPVRAGKLVLDRKPPRGDIKILAPRQKFCRFVTSAYTRLSNSHPEAEVSAKPPGSGRRSASAQPDADAGRSLSPWRRLIQPAFPAQPAGLL